MAILMYPKRLFDLAKKAYPALDDSKCANLLLTKIYPQCKDKNSKFKVAFYQPNPVEVRTRAYWNAKNTAEELARVAKLPRAPMIFRHVKNAQDCGLPVFNVKKFHRDNQKAVKEKETCVEQISLDMGQTESIDIEKLKNLIKMADGAIGLSTGNDSFLALAQTLIREAALMVGGADNGR